MKAEKSYLLAAALCAGLAVGPVMAEEASDFHALSQVETNAAPMTQDKLAATEGGLFIKIGVKTDLDAFLASLLGLILGSVPL